MASPRVTMSISFNGGLSNGTYMKIHGRSYEWD